MVVKPMANYFRGPSTPQMRLTMLLVGTFALIVGIYSGTHEVESSATADWGGQVHASCGSAFDPYPAGNFSQSWQPPVMLPSAHGFPWRLLYCL